MTLGTGEEAVAGTRKGRESKMAEKRNQTKATRREFLEGAGVTAAVMLAGQRKAAFAQGRPQTGAADWPRSG